MKQQIEYGIFIIEQEGMFDFLVILILQKNT